MKTITLNILNDMNLLKEQKSFNCMVRYAFKRFEEGFDEKDTRALAKSIFKDQKSWFLQCAVKDGQSVYKSANGEKVVFGGINNLKKYLNGKKSKEQYKLDKLRPILIQGEACKKGNRSFEFHLDECYVIYKYSKYEHFKIEFERPRREWFRELKKIQQSVNECMCPITVGINVVKSKLSISFDEKLLKQETYKGLKDNRVVGIDLNPNYIGLCVLEFSKNDSENFTILHKEVISTYELNRKDVKTGKRRYELVKIAQHIDKLVNYWKCSKLCMEDLKIKNTEDGTKQKSISKKEFNRLTKNVWCKNLIVNKLKMLSNIKGYTVIEINPCYSSFIGNTLYGNENTPDMVAASVEIARRGYNKYKKDHFYPFLNIHRYEELWKQTLNGVKTWKDLFKKAKKSERKYRFLILDCIQNAVFSKTYNKLKVSYYTFV